MLARDDARRASKARAPSVCTSCAKLCATNAAVCGVCSHKVSSASQTCDMQHSCTQASTFSLRCLQGYPASHCTKLPSLGTQSVVRSEALVAKPRASKPRRTPTSTARPPRIVALELSTQTPPFSRNSCVETAQKNQNQRSPRRSERDPVPHQGLREHDAALKEWVARARRVLEQLIVRLGGMHWQSESVSLYGTCGCAAVWWGAARHRGTQQRCRMAVRWTAITDSTVYEREQQHDTTKSLQSDLDDLCLRYSM